MQYAIYGSLAIAFVNKAMGELSKHNQLFSRFSKGLDVANAKNQYKDFELFRDLENEKDIKHTEKMLHDVMVALNKIIVSQVQKETCKRISPKLKSFLRAITTIKNRHPVDMQPRISKERGPSSVVNARYLQNNTQQHYIFKKNQAALNDKQNQKKLEEEIHVVTQLLTDFNKLHPVSKYRTRRLKNYLNNHLNLLKYVSSNLEQENHATTVNKISNLKTRSNLKPSLEDRNSVFKLNSLTNPNIKTENFFYQNLQNINNRNKNLEYKNDENFNKQHLLKNQNIGSNDFNYNSYSGNIPVSSNYQKLANAVNYWKEKRQKETMIGELYGDHSNRFDNENGFRNKEITDVSKMGFEHLVPFNLS